MPEISSQQFKQAFIRWFRDFPEKDFDLRVIPFLSPEIEAFQKGGLLRKARRASLLSTGQMAERLKITRSAYAYFEKREEQGLLTLEKLARFADAMDCELVYAIRPKNRMRFSQRIWKSLLPSAMESSWARSRPPQRKPEALAAMARRAMKDPEFRRQKDWCERVRI